MTDGTSPAEETVAASPKTLSIIIPVYNGTEYLDRCVDSVLSQRRFGQDDLEILLLDDGSTDASLEAIRRLEKAHPTCVRGLHHPNMGVAATRNRGIEEARGTYVMFIDQDDWIDDDYCRTYHDAIEATGADVVYGGYRRPDRTGKVRSSMVPSPAPYSRFIVMAAWAKIHSRAFLISSGARFFSNKFGEDNVFTVTEIAATDRWHRIDYVGYNWFYNEGSVSNTSQRGLTADNTAHLMAMLQALRAAAGSQRASYAVRYYLLRTIVFYLLFSGRRSRAGDFVQAQKLFFDWHRTHCGPLRGREVFGPRGETTQARLAILVMITLDRLKLTGLFARAYCQPGSRA